MQKCKNYMQKCKKLYAKIICKIIEICIINYKKMRETSFFIQN